MAWGWVFWMHAQLQVLLPHEFEAVLCHPCAPHSPHAPTHPPPPPPPLNSLEHCIANLFFVPLGIFVGEQLWAVRLVLLHRC